MYLALKQEQCLITLRRAHHVAAILEILVAGFASGVISTVLLNMEYVNTDLHHGISIKLFYIDISAMCNSYKANALGGLSLSEGV